MLKIFKKIKKLKYKNQKKGIALVIAITVTTLLLSISLSISNIVLRQIRITSVNNQSKSAFFAADSAIECAAYYDTVYIPVFDLIDTSKVISQNKDFAQSIFGSILNNPVETIVRCGNYLNGGVKGKPLNIKKNISNLERITTTFDIAYDTDMCASVEVIRTEVETTITARGYNVGVNEAGTECDLTNLDKKRVVERGLTVKY